jgi:hypothetical protein
VARLERGLTWTRWVCEEDGCEALEPQGKLDAVDPPMAGLR